MRKREMSGKLFDYWELKSRTFNCKGRIALSCRCGEVLLGRSLSTRINDIQMLPASS